MKRIKNIGLFLGHPAHFHNLKNLATKLQREGYNVFFAVKQKDILEELCKDYGYEYTKLRGERGNSKWAMIKSVIEMEYKMCRFIRKNQIDLLIGTTLSFAAAKICRIPVFAMNEDDAYIAPRYAKLAYPFATEILSPYVCNNGKWNDKSNKYPSFQKLSYLHPNYFIASPEIVRKNGIDPTKQYFLMRFVSLNAHHDKGISGINTDIAQQLIEILSPHGQIYITSERPLEPQFEKYRLHINPLDIHHVMAFATIYIGDSQSMANEAAMLGTPSLRFNDFVGVKKIGVMEELENHYGLTFGISGHEPEKLYAKLAELLAMPNLHEEFAKRRAALLHDVIDVTKFFTWFVVNYPSSSSVAKNQPIDSEFWKQFK